MININQDNLKYLLKLRNKITSFKDSHNVERYKSKLKSLLPSYVKKDLLFFQVKIYFKEEDPIINSDLKRYMIINEYNKIISKEIKLIEFIYINGEMKNKNNLCVKLLIGVKSIIGYNKLLYKRYKNIFRNGINIFRNIEIKYISNSKKIKKTINKLLKCEDVTKQRLIFKNQVYVYDFFTLEHIEPDSDAHYYNDFRPKIRTISFDLDVFLKLDKEFNSQYIMSVRKISVFSLINIWKTYCIINDIYYSNNKLYKKFIFRDREEDPKIQPIKIKINNRLISIDNRECLLSIDGSEKYRNIDVKYIYIGELDYLVKNINFIMKFILKCYSQEMSRNLTRKIKSLYLKKAFKLLKQMPNLYITEVNVDK